MNDRFKFRVYDKIANKYWFSGCVNINTDGVVFIIPADSNEKFMHLGNDTVIIEQCTGLKDKNGNLVYEGDLIKSPSNSYPLEIVRMPNGVYGCKVCKIHPVWEMNLYSLTNAYDVEIIGNIHEQAEQKDK